MARIFASLAMHRLLQQVDRMGGRDFSVLITGETGSGKEVVARIVHERSRRASAPFIDFNCAAIPETLLESELFGYEQGAFSGALKTKPGLFEMADGGTLLLDEIGELPKMAQAKLLRVLDGMPFYRLGGTRKISSDARILAATNLDLESAVKTGSFRSDLYYRLAEVHLRVPPLRERVADIAPLACAFLAQISPGYHFSPDAIKLLEDCAWTGNIRELRNAVAGAAMASLSELVTADAFQGAAQRAAAQNPQTLDHQEKALILATLEATGGNRVRAAARLGISSRTLSRKMLQYTGTPEPCAPSPAADLAALDRAIRAGHTEAARNHPQTVPM